MHRKDFFFGGLKIPPLYELCKKARKREGNRGGRNRVKKEWRGRGRIKSIKNRNRIQNQWRMKGKKNFLITLEFVPENSFYHSSLSLLIQTDCLSLPFFSFRLRNWNVIRSVVYHCKVSPSDGFILYPSFFLSFSLYSFLSFSLSLSLFLTLVLFAHSIQVNSSQKELKRVWE